MDWRNGFVPPVSGNLRARLFELLKDLPASEALSLRTDEAGEGIIKLALSYRYESDDLVLTDRQISATADVLEDIERRWGYGKYQLWMDKVMVADTPSTDRPPWIGEGVEVYTRYPVVCIAPTCSSRWSYTGGSSRGWICIERFAGCRGQGLLSSAPAYSNGPLDLRPGHKLGHEKVREQLKEELPNLLEGALFTNESDRESLRAYSRTRREPVIGEGGKSAVTGIDAFPELLDPKEVYETLLGDVLPPEPSPYAFLGGGVSEVGKMVFGLLVDKRSGVAMVASPVMAGVRVAVCRGTVPVTPSTIRASDPALSAKVGFGTEETRSSSRFPDVSREGICSYIRENCGEDHIHWIAPYAFESTRVYVVEVCKSGGGGDLNRAQDLGVSGYISDKILVDLPASARMVQAQRLVYETGSHPRCLDILHRSAGFFRDATSRLQDRVAPSSSNENQDVDPNVVVVMTRANEVMRHACTEGRELLAALTCAVRVQAGSAEAVPERPSRAFRIVDNVPYRVAWPRVSLASALVVFASMTVLMWSVWGTVGLAEWWGLLAALVALAFPAVGITHRCYYGKWDIFDAFIGRMEVTPSTRLSTEQEWDLLKTSLEANAAGEVYAAEGNCYLGRARGSRRGPGPMEMSELRKLGYILGVSRKGCYILQRPSGPNLTLTLKLTVNEEGGMDSLHATEDKDESLYLAAEGFTGRVSGLATLPAGMMVPKASDIFVASRAGHRLTVLS